MSNAIVTRRVGLIVNDGKELAVQTALTIQDKLEKAGLQVIRTSSSGGMGGFANPDQHMRMLGYNACVPDGFDSSMSLAMTTSPSLVRRATEPILLR